jgi:hypothetical protein
MCTAEEGCADRLLVDVCLRGDEGAWERLYRECHPGLLHLTRKRFGHKLSADEIEEVEASVWEMLLEGNGSPLGRYDPARGCRLVTYLMKYVRLEVRRVVRRSRRFLLWPDEAAILLGSGAPIPTRLLLTDFLDTLTPREREFCETDLLGGSHSPGISRCNAWQLRRRVRNKLRSFTAIA